MADPVAALRLLGESGWAVLVDAGLALDAARGNGLAAAELLRKRRPGEPAVVRSTALELVAEGARLATKLGLPGERLLAVREAVEQASAGRVATWHASRFDAEDRVVEIGCGCGGDSVAIAHRVRNLLAVDVDPVRAACAHSNLAAFGSSWSRAVPGDGFAVLAGEGRGATAVFADPGRRPGGVRTLDPEAWEPPLSAFVALASGPGAPRVLVKAAPSLDADPYTDVFAAAYVSCDGACVECFLESAPPPSAGGVLPRVRAVLLPRDGPSVELSGDRGDAPVASAPALPGGALYTVDPAAVRARLLAELCRGTGLALAADGVAFLVGPGGVVTAPASADGPGAAAPWLTEYRVLATAGVGDAPDALRRIGAGSLRVHVRGVAPEPDALERAWRRSLRSGGPAVDAFVHPDPRIGGAGAAGRSARPVVLLTDRVPRPGNAGGPGPGREGSPS